MLNARMDRSPVSRVSGWLVALGLVALTVPIAGLSLSGEGVAPVGTAPRTADIVLAPTSAVPASPTAEPGFGRAEPSRPIATPQQNAAPSAFAVIVTDQLGRTVPQAAVSLSNEAAGLHPELRTDLNGEGAFSGLPAGEYQLRASKPGFKTVKMGVALVAGRTTTSRVTLQLGMLAETVVVSAKPGVAPVAVGSAQPGVAAPAGTFAPQARHVGEAPAEDPCAQSAEGGCVTPPRKLVDAKPVYPAWAVEAGTSGTVVINGRLRADGSVGNIQPTQGADPVLAEAAVQAMRLWQYSPVRLDGVAMEVDIELTVRFVAEKR
jgi:TonB family protein